MVTAGRPCAPHWVAVLLLVVYAGSAHGALRFHWLDDFTDAERARLTRWISGTQAALESLVGVPQFDVHIYMRRRDGAGEPVPWAHTRRDDRPGVVFHVDASQSLAEFRADWTAPHELSHLVLPHLGDEHSWFAEGFASYMQYQVMHAMGVLSAAEVAERYRERLGSARAAYRFPDLPFVQAAPRLRAERKYPVMYWGGAAYFLRADARLRSAGSSVVAVSAKYLACCRRPEETLDALVAALDRTSGNKVFGPLLEEYRTVPGFPR